MNQLHLPIEVVPTAQCSDLNPPINEATLVQKAQAGDAEALNCLICWHRPALCRHARHACGAHSNAAEDICQEACLKATSNLSCLADASNFRGWVYSIIDNLARHLKRKLKIVCTRSEEIGTDIVETMSALVDNKSEADMTTLLALLSSQVPELRESRRQTAIVMIEYYAAEHEFPTVRLIAQATHSSQGAAQLNRRGVLASWRHILVAHELEVPSHRRPVL